jgi:hypothetical protein
VRAPRLNSINNGRLIWVEADAARETHRWQMELVSNAIAELVEGCDMLGPR